MLVLTQLSVGAFIAWLVLEPSKPHSGSSAPSGRIFVLERNFCVGCVPSIQMYSAL